MYNHDDTKDSSPDNSPFGDGGLTEARLWDYIDGLSNEGSVIEKLIQENSGWKAKYAELLEIHQLMSSTELEHPSLRFSKNVMDEIARYQVAPAAKKYINSKIIWGIAVFLVTMFAGFIIYGFAQINWSEAGSATSPLGVDLGSVDYSKMFNNSFMNLFMMLNIILGLLLLDRYLNTKRKAMREMN